MAADEKWYFTKEQLQETASRRCGFDADKELSYRQQAANFIQDMGQKLQVSQLCINTAIVYMHRFYMFHSFTYFPWNTIAAAAFFLAAKVEEQPRKLEHVIRVANHCLHRDQSQTFDVKSEQYAAQSQELVFNENVLLQTLGFDVAIDHPHTHVVRCCHLVKASKDLAQTSYFMASNSLHLTTMCLQYKPTVVACFCIYLACKWSNWQILKSIEGKDWFYYVDKNVTLDLLEQLTDEFLKIFDKCPSRLKKKISLVQQHSGQISQISQISQINTDPTASTSLTSFDIDYKKGYEIKDMPTYHPKLHHEQKPALLATPEDPHKKTQRPPHDSFTNPQQQQQQQQRNDYREKKERERLERSLHHSKPAVAPVPGGKHMAGIPNAGPNTKSIHASNSHHNRPVSVDPNKMKMQQSHHRDPKDPSVTNGRDHRSEVASSSKRDFLVQPQVKVDDMTSSLASVPAVKVDNSVVLEKQRYDSSSRSKTVDPKLQIKPQQQQHEMTRHRRDIDPKYQKRPGSGLDAQTVQPSEVNKKPSNTLNKLVNSTSQSQQQQQQQQKRSKSPFVLTDASKSVPSLVPQAQLKSETRNGNHTSVSAPNLLQLDDSHSQSSMIDESLLLPKKPASLFSPEKTPPQKNAWSMKPAPVSGKQLPNSQQQIPQINSPPVPTTPIYKRSRSSGSGSEPELRPVVKKLDQISGFENIIRDSKMGIKLPKVPDIIQPICDRSEPTPPVSLHPETSISKELKPPDIIKPFNVSTENIPLVNGIETDPAMISTLLKEVAAAPPAVANHLGNEVPVDEKQKSERHHKSEKKKKKEKHKHKDRDKSKDEKKKKHKEKERHKSKSDKNEAEIEVPLKITIQKSKVQPSVETTTTTTTTPVSSSGLKVKISKDRLKSDTITDVPIPAPPSSALKIKISKDQIQYNSAMETVAVGNNGRKREKLSPPALGAPPAKQMKMMNNYIRPQSENNMVRANGRNSYNNKVTQLGEGEATQLRLAESKYHSKGASKTS